MKCSASRSRERACERLNRTGRSCPGAPALAGLSALWARAASSSRRGSNGAPPRNSSTRPGPIDPPARSFRRGTAPTHIPLAQPARTHNADTDIRRELSQPSDSSSRAPIYIVGAVVWPLAVGGGNGCNVAARMQAPQAIRIGGTHASGWRAARQCTSDRTDLCRHLPRAGCRHFRNGGGRLAHIGVPDPYRDPVIPRLGDWTR